MNVKLLKGFVGLALFYFPCAGLHGQNSMNVHLNNGEVVRIYLPVIDSITYTLGTPEGLPVLWTLPLDSITNNGARAGGNVVAEGNSPVLQRGVCWSPFSFPTINDSVTVAGPGPGPFQLWITGTGSSTYHVRAFAINSAGVRYGNEKIFTTLPPSSPGGGVIDFDGNAYPTLVFGNGQEWMAQNLYTTHFSNGDLITQVEDSSVWSGLNTAAWCSVANDPANAVPFGHSYNWFAVSDARNVCPMGWHMPSDVEWQSLVAYLGGETVAGGKLKSTGDEMSGTGVWWENYGATNESGFTALPAGNRPAAAGIYSNFGWNAFFWTSSVDPDDITRAWAWVCQYLDATTFHGNYEKRMGFSVRCVKN